MATNPKKTIDPTEAALSAIQEALNIRDEEEHAKAAPEQPERSSDPFGGPRADEPREAPAPASPAPEMVLELRGYRHARSCRPVGTARQ